MIPCLGRWRALPKSAPWLKESKKKLEVGDLIPETKIELRSKKHPFQGSYYVEMISGQINILPRVIRPSQKPCLDYLALATMQVWESWKGQQVYCGLARNRVVDESVSFHLKLGLDPPLPNLQHVSILSYAFCYSLFSQDWKSIVLHFSLDSYHRQLRTMELLVFCLAIWSNFIFSLRDSLTRWLSFGDPPILAFRFSSFRRSSSSVFILSLALFFDELNRENPRLISIFTIPQKIVASVTSLYFSLALKIINFIFS